MQWLLLACCYALVVGDARNFLLSSTGSQAVLFNNPFIGLFSENPLKNLAPDVDVIYLHMEEYGVPWDVLSDQVTPPPNWEWTLFMQNLSAQAANAGNPVFIGLVIGRNTLGHRASVGVNNSMVIDDITNTTCFDFNSTQGQLYQTAYLNYVTWMVKTFKPEYVNVAVETNIFLANCPAQWEAMVNVEQAAYATVKAIQPSTVVFPSIALPYLYNFTADGFDINHYNNLANLKRDRFAVSAYPSGLSYTNQTFLWYPPSALPSDYLTRGGDYNGEITLVAETGWDNYGMLINFNETANPPTCIDIVPSSDEYQEEYIQYLFKVANSSSIDLIVWWSFWDLMPEFVMQTCFPNAANCNTTDSNSTLPELEYWCYADNVFREGQPDGEGDIIFKAFASMGLRDYNNSLKTGQWDLWVDTLNLPVVPKGGNATTSTSSTFTTTTTGGSTTMSSLTSSVSATGGSSTTTITSSSGGSSSGPPTMTSLTSTLASSTTNPSSGPPLTTSHIITTSGNTSSPASSSTSGTTASSTSVATLTSTTASSSSTTAATTTSGSATTASSAATTTTVSATTSTSVATSTSTAATSSSSTASDVTSTTVSATTSTSAATSTTSATTSSSSTTDDTTSTSTTSFTTGTSVTGITLTGGTTGDDSTTTTTTTTTGTDTSSGTSSTTTPTTISTSGSTSNSTGNSSTTSPTSSGTTNTAAALTAKLVYVLFLAAMVMAIFLL